MQLRIDVSQDRVEAAIFGQSKKNFDISLDVGPAQPLLPLPGDRGRYRVQTLLRCESPAGAATEDLGWSIYRVPADGLAIKDGSTA